VTCENQGRAPNVVLVSMPWTTLHQPSLGLAILAAQLREHGIRCRVFHANLLLLKHLSHETYNAIAHCDVLNEFLFTGPLDQMDEAQLQQLHLRCQRLCAADRHPIGYDDPEQFAELALVLRNRVIPEFLAECADRVLAMEPTLVGASCLFDQTIASVALARLLKDVRPELPVVLGGYAVQHENGTEILKAFPEIDAIARGDGEETILALARASVSGSGFRAIPGVSVRDAPERTAAAQRFDLRQALAPDFDDWFADQRHVEGECGIATFTEALPIENSRGCWWGQHSHCTFCGIDEDTLKYRSKTPEQVVAEIERLRSKHGADFVFRFSDYILPYNAHKDLFPALAALDPSARFECEIKANQTRERVRAIATAGFQGVQPGIESFSTPILKMMHKGVKAIQNVQLLKWGYIDGIVINYNILFGFPGENPEHYRHALSNMPRLYHLNPPFSRTEVALTRFAPLYEDPSAFGIDGKSRYIEYNELLFSGEFMQRKQFNLDKYCYYFERNYQHSPEMIEIHNQICLQVDHWKAQHVQKLVALGYVRMGDRYQFFDSRFEANEVFELTGAAGRLYSLCDEKAVGEEESARRLREAGEFSLEEIQSAFATLEERRLVWRSDDMVFGLAVPMDIVKARVGNQWHRAWPALAERWGRRLREKAGASAAAVAEAVNPPGKSPQAVPAGM
jgi:ribosomal peptide maturation radical SAM protein 1